MRRVRVWHKINLRKPIRNTGSHRAALPGCQVNDVNPEPLWGVMERYRQEITWIELKDLSWIGNACRMIWIQCARQGIRGRLGFATKRKEGKIHIFFAHRL